MLNRFVRRRLKYAALLLIALVGLGFWVHWLDASLARTAHATGYALYLAIFFLGAYNLRKKFPGLPLGSSSTWLQAHIYVALGTVFLLYSHISGRWPDGWIEGSLTAIYAGTFLSGLYGLWITRTTPRKLARVNTQVVFEQIPRERRRVGVEARATVLKAVQATGSTTLSEYYADRLHGFFERPRTLSYWVHPTSSTRKRLFHELSAISRLLTDAEQTACDRLFRLVQEKDDLDFHASKQGVLKVWIFFHLSLTWLLLSLGALHGLLANAMHGGHAG